MALDDVGGQFPVPTAPKETVPFTIGGLKIDVPVLTLRTLQARREHFLIMDQDMDWITYSACVLQILETALERTRPDLTFELMRDVLSKPEADQLVVSFNELLLKSGFTSPGEEQAVVENSGTGTSTPSSENSPPPVSVAETSTGSSTATHSDVIEPSSGPGK